MVKQPIKLMKNTQQKIKGEGNYWALLCYCGCESGKEPLICGVFATKREAEEFAEEVKDCSAKHIIKKCKVEIEL